MDELVSKLLAQQGQYIGLLESSVEHCSELLAQSESRIDRTNDMICALAQSASNLEHTLAHITKEYCLRIDALASNRDAIVEQNRELMKEHMQDREEIRQLREEQKALSSQLLSLVAELSRSQSGVRISNNLGDDSR